MNMRLNRIDGLRGLAILGVILVHFYRFPVPEKIIIQSLGLYGVNLFFLISGFILCYVKDRANYSNKVFFLKRFFRLAPLYYLVIITCYLVGYNNELEPTTPIMPLDLKNFLMHISFLHGLFPEYLRSIYGVAWSLTPEIIFYLVFPFLFKLPPKWLIGSFVGFFIITQNKYYLSMLFLSGSSPVNDIWINHSPLGNMFLFIFGMLVYKFPEFFKSKQYTAFGIAGVILFFMSGFGMLGKDFIKVSNFIFSNAYIGYILIAFPFMVYSKDRITALLLDNKFMVYLGKWSYSAFFIHYALIALYSFYNIKFNLILSFTSIVLLTMFLSFLSYTFIEQPCIRIGNYFISKLKNISWFDKKYIEAAKG